MAEVIGLIASITAIVGIAGTATKLSRSLYRLAREAGSAEDEVRTLAANIAAFASVVRVAHDSLRTYCKKQLKSPALVYIKNH